MSISEELELDISGALDAIESLNQPLTELGTTLTDTLNTAIESVDVTPIVEQLSALDASGLTTTIDAAVQEADGQVPIEADTEAVPGEIDSSIESADGTVVIEADASAVPSEIDSSIESADSTVVIDADASGVGAEIESEIDSADTTVVIEADGSALTELGDDAQGAVGGLDNAASSLNGLAGAGGAVIGGDVLGGLTSGLGSAGPAGAAAAAGIGLFTGGVTALVAVGTDALATQQRFASTFGNLATEASRVKLGGLNSDLGELAIKLGSDDEGLQDAASSLFQFGKSAGFTSKQSLELVNNASALAARAVALNPALGQVGDVANGITNAFARGGKFASKYGLALTAAEINARALQNTGKATNADLTQQEKAFAGSQIAAEKYGKTIEKDVNKGSENASIKQRSLNEQLNNFLEEAGKPLVAPFQQILKELLPVVKALLPVFGELAQAVLPAIVQVIKDNVPTIKLFGELFKELSPIIQPLIRVSLLLLNPLAGISSAFGNISSSGAGVADIFTGIGDAISGLLDDVTNLGGALVDDFLTGIQEAFPAVTSFFASVRDTVVLAVGNLAIALTQKGIDLVTGFVKGIIDTAVDLFNFFRNLAGTIVSTIGDVAGTLVQKGIDLISGLIAGLVQEVVGVFNFFRSLPGRVASTIGNTARVLFHAGVDLIQGLIDGIIRKAGDIVGVLKKRVTGVIPGFIKDALGIGSPSKVLAAIGEDIGDGLIQGLDASLTGIEQASAAMTAAATPVMPAVSALPAVAAALPSAGAAASTVGSGASAGSLGATGGSVVNNIIVQSAAPNPVDVGFEVIRQLQAATYRTQR